MTEAGTGARAAPPRRLPWILVLILVPLAAVWLHVMAGEEDGGPSADGGQSVMRPAELPPAASWSRHRTIRAIAPELVPIPPPDALDGLERVEPRAPHGSPAASTVPDARGTIRIVRPLASAAGRIDTTDHAITIAGIEVVDSAQVCAASGRQWPCGMAARTAFRQFLRGRTIECALPAPVREGPVSLACNLGGQDLGTWLVAQGWALAAGDGPYADTEEEARRARRGIHGDGQAYRQPPVRRPVHP